MSEPTHDSVHAYSDLDSGPEAQHHTLGNRPEQAARGNHTHSISGAVLPAATITQRGQLFAVSSGVGVADGLYVCLKSNTETYSWKLIVSG